MTGRQFQLISQIDGGDLFCNTHILIIRKVLRLRRPNLWTPNWAIAKFPGGAKNQTLATRVVWFLAGVLLVLLAFRFVFALLGANPSKPFAHFIYAASYPFVAPFFGLFHYHLAYGVSQVELCTLVAMAVYAIIAWALDKLFNIARA